MANADLSTSCSSVSNLSVSYLSVKFSRLHKYILLLSCLLPLFGALAYFVWWPGYENTKTIYSTFKVLQFAIPVLTWTLLTKNLPTQVSNLFCKMPLHKSGAVTSLIFLVVGFATYFMALQETLAVAGVRQALTEKLAEFGVTSSFGFCVLAFFLAVVHSFLEEYYWRGFVLAELQNYFSSWVAMLLSALAFTLHHIVVINRYAHVENSLTVVIAASSIVFACGVFWAWQFLKYRNIYIVWLSHIAADLVILGIGYDIVYR